MRGNIDLCRLASLKKIAANQQKHINIVIAKFWQAQLSKTFNLWEETEKPYISKRNNQAAVWNNWNCIIKKKGKFLFYRYCISMSGRRRARSSLIMKQYMHLIEREKL